MHSNQYWCNANIAYCTKVSTVRSVDTAYSVVLDVVGAFMLHDSYMHSTFS